MQDALALTTTLRTDQRAADLAEKRRREEDEKNKARAFWNSKAGIAERERLDIERLRKEGKLPPIPKEQPTIQH